MSDATIKEPCNCEQAMELTELLQEFIFIASFAEERNPFSLIAEKAGRILQEYEDAQVEASKCGHCGQIGGH